MSRILISYRKIIARALRRHIFHIRGFIINPLDIGTGIEILQPVRPEGRLKLHRPSLIDAENAPSLRHHNPGGINGILFPIILRLPILVKPASRQRKFMPSIKTNTRRVGTQSREVGTQSPESSSHCIVTRRSDWVQHGIPQKIGIGLSLNTTKTTQTKSHKPYRFDKPYMFDCKHNPFLFSIHKKHFQTLNQIPTRISFPSSTTFLSSTKTPLHPQRPAGFYNYSKTIRLGFRPLPCPTCRSGSSGSSGTSRACRAARNR